MKQNERIVNLYRDGVRPVDIAREVGTSEWTVHHRLKRLGAEKHGGRTPVAIAAEARALHGDGIPIREIATRLGRDPRTVKKLIDEAKTS
jgi:AraC-type DNA-binding domain-containing proteins